MRIALALVGLLAVAHPVVAQSPVPRDSSASPAQGAQPSLASAPLRLLPIGQVPVSSFPANKPIHCCSAKGALIGLGIGAGLGALAVRYTCDSSDCTSAYLGAMAVAGGLGAGIGAIVGGPSLTRPRTFPVAKHVGVGPVVTRTAGGGAVAVRF